MVKYTDYIGELVYEGNALQFIQHAEGRVLPDGAGWEYQYHLKDHLGNVRVTFTTKPQTPVNYTANLETGTASSGETIFGNYTSTSFDLVDHTDAGTTYQKVQWLNGGASGRFGLTKSLSVMPGDRVSITAYAKYMNLSGTGNTNPFAAALTAAFGVSSGSTGEQLKLYNGLNNYGLSVAGGDHPLDDETSPKAFVTILLFDRNFNLLDAAWDQVNSADGLQSSATVKEPPHDQLFKEVTVQEAGYAYIFLSNEHPTYVDVYLDDVTVTHTTSPIVSSADYYPFGLTYNSYRRENSTENRYLYNQGTGGKKFNTERITDLDLNIDLTKYRAYDPAIARWWQVDPKVDELYSWTPYNYAFNNAILYNDPEGDIPPLIWGILAIAALVLDAEFAEAPGTDQSPEAQQRAQENREFQGNVNDAVQTIVNPANLTRKIVGQGVKKTLAAEKKTAPTKPAKTLEQRTEELNKKDRSGKPFTKAGKEVVKERNASRNDGQTTCVDCGTKTQPAKKHEKGVTPPGNATHVDHEIPKSEGGSGTPNNGEVRCRDYNLKKSNTTPQSNE